MTLHVQRVGDAGPDLVFLHGWGLSSRIWEPLARRLSGDCRCHLVDLPGHGASAPGPVGLNNWADTVVEAVARPALYVGWSLGGLIALGAARRHPHAVQRLVLIASLPRFVREPGWAYGMKSQAIEATREGLARDFTTTLSEFLMQQVLGEPGAGRAVRSLRNDLIEHPPTREGLEHGLDILYEADFRDHLAAIDMPTLAIAGARDRMAHPDGMGWMAERMPTAECLRIERAAHAPFLSHEKDVAAYIRAHASAIRMAAPRS